MAGTATVINGDARNLPLADGTVDLIVTSPPYFALRDYKDGDGSLEGQIGAEATPQEFLEALWECSQEWWRVLAPGGSLWVNLGDKYNAKSLMGLPWRYAIGMVDGQGDPDGAGWILRAEVIWAKPNGLPESVRDRVARKHEQWFHFTKSERYYSAVDAIREQYQTSRDNPGGGNTYRAMRKAGAKDTNLGGAGYHALGKLPGSVWTVATEPLKVPAELGVDHFAAFPTEWPRRIILGWAPTHGVCQTCGEGLRPVRSSWACACDAPILTPTGHRTAADPSKDTGRAGFNRLRGDSEGTTVTTRWEHRHWADELRNSPYRGRIERLAARLYGPHAFAHYIRTDTSGARPLPVAFREALLRRGWITTPPPMNQRTLRPAVVLDPFGGTGTTAAVAKALGCHGISVDLSADYCRLAQWRTNGDGYDKVRRKIEQRTPSLAPAQLALTGDET
jgi:DNA modification methylase